MPAYFELKKSTDGQFVFNLKTSDGSTLLTSERYTTKSAAENGIASVRKNATDANRFEKRIATDESHYFVLKAANGQIIGQSRRFKSEPDADHTIALVSQEAPSARLSDLTVAIDLHVLKDSAVPPEHTVISTVRSRDLSLWQSAVAKVARESLEQAGEQHDVFAHPMVQAANVHVQHLVDNAELPPHAFLEHLDEDDDPHLALSNLHLQLAQAEITGDTEEAERIRALLARKFSGGDVPTGWAKCLVEYVKYYGVRGNRAPVYRSWKDDSNQMGVYFGEIDWKLPVDSKIAIIGDWATGMDDARALVHTIMTHNEPDVIIHLGDIYYSGTEEECRHAFLDIFDSVFTEIGYRVPVFNIPGNHDYYSGGQGFYNTIDNVNTPLLFSAKQEASFFCLRSEDDAWQILGMDTGYNDHVAELPFGDPHATKLRSDEIEWLHYHIDNFDGKTILLSHHQPFSAYSKVQADVPQWQNPALINVFKPYFSNKIAAWFWGHEHNLVLFQDGLVGGLKKGRLVGCSGYEMGGIELSTQGDPYTVKFPEAAYLDATKYRLDKQDGYYNHGYAILDFGHRDFDDDPITASYWQFPSWGGKLPPGNLLAPARIYDELIGRTREEDPEIINGADLIQLESADGENIISHFLNGNEFIPTLQKKAQGHGIHLRLLGKLGPIKDGDTIRIQTTETRAQAWNLLGKFGSNICYYWSNEDKYIPNTQWQIRIKDQTHPKQAVRDGHEVYFEHQGYTLTTEKERSDSWLTIDKSDPPTTWKIKKVHIARPGRVPLQYGDKIKILTWDGHAFTEPRTQYAGEYARNLYFAQIDKAEDAIIFEIGGGQGVIKKDDTITLKTEYLQVGVYNMLTKWHRNPSFHFHKPDNSDRQIFQMISYNHYGDIHYGDVIGLRHSLNWVYPVSSPAFAAEFPMYVQESPNAWNMWKFEKVE